MQPERRLEICREAYSDWFHTSPKGWHPGSRVWLAVKQNVNDRGSWLHQPDSRFMARLGDWLETLTERSFDTLWGLLHQKRVVCMYVANWSACSPLKLCLTACNKKKAEIFATPPGELDRISCPKLQCPTADPWRDELDQLQLTSIDWETQRSLCCQQFS